MNNTKIKNDFYSSDKFKTLDFDTKPLKTFAKTPCGKDIVSMVEFEGRLIVATVERVYLLSESGVFTAIFFEHANN